MTTAPADDPPGDQRRWPFWCCFAVIAAAVAAITWSGAEGTHWPWLVVAGFIAFTGLVGAWRFFPKGRVTVRSVLLAALMLRALMFPLGGELSDDYHRYQWDGASVRAGINPYLHRPVEIAADESFADEATRRAWFAAMNSPDYYSIYPPLSQFSFAAVSGYGYWGLKALFALAELGALLLISRLLDARRLLLYAWNPLLLLETWGQPHTEALALLGLAAGLWCWQRRRPMAATAAFTLAGWVKLFPLLLLPFLWRRIGAGRERWLSMLLAAGISIALWWPFFSLTALAHIYESTHLYMLSFEFNAGPYYLLKYLSTEALRALGWLTDHQDSSKVIGPLMRILLLCGLLWLWRSDRGGQRSLNEVTAWLIALFLLTFVNLHPWYLTFAVFAVPWMSPARRVAWLWLCACSLGTYLSYSHGIYWPFVIVGWLGFTVIAGSGWFRNRQSKP